jgi:hypothetical protein
MGSLFGAGKGGKGGKGLGGAGLGAAFGFGPKDPFSRGKRGGGSSRISDTGYVGKRRDGSKGGRGGRGGGIPGLPI